MTTTTGALDGRGPAQPCDEPDFAARTLVGWHVLFGLMVAAELTQADGSPDPARTSAVLAHCLQESNLVLMSCGADGNVIRFMPPLVVSEGEIDAAISAFDFALAATAS